MTPEQLIYGFLASVLSLFVVLYLTGEDDHE